MKNKVFRLFLIGSLMLMVCVSAFVVSADLPAASQSSITIMDGGSPVEFDINDIAVYHAKMEAAEDGTKVPEKAEVDPCCAWMYRSLLAGIPALWGDKSPERSDITLTSNLPSCGALHTGWYVTGTGEGINTTSPGKLILLKPDGTELTDYSHEARSKIAKNRTAENYKIILASTSNGKSVEVALRKEAFPDGFFESFKKVKTDPNVTKEDVLAFNELKDEFLNNLLEKPDRDLFTIVIR